MTREEGRKEEAKHDLLTCMATPQVKNQINFADVIQVSPPTRAQGEGAAAAGKRYVLIFNNLCHVGFLDKSSR